MKLKENISIDEFDGKRYQIRIVEPNNGKAVLTHYLHNIRNGVSKYYKKVSSQKKRQKHKNDSIMVRNPKYEAFLQKVF